MLGSVLCVVVAYGRGVILIEGCLVNAHVGVGSHGIIGRLCNSAALANGDVSGLVAVFGLAVVRLAVVRLAVVGLVVILRILERNSVDNVYNDRVLFVALCRLDDRHPLAKCYEVAVLNADTAVAGCPDNLVGVANQGQLMALAKVKVKCYTVLDVELAALDNRLVGSTENKVATNRIKDDCQHQKPRDKQFLYRFHILNPLLRIISQ